MSNISYPKFGKVKTITLPIEHNTLTWEEYKEKYGIDLRDLVRLNSGKQIVLKEESLIIFNLSEVQNTGYSDIPAMLPLPSTLLSVPYSASDDALLSFFINHFDSGSGEIIPFLSIDLIIRKENDLDLDNLEIQITEI